MELNEPNRGTLNNRHKLVKILEAAFANLPEFNQRRLEYHAGLGTPILCGVNAVYYHTSGVTGWQGSPGG